MALTPNLSQGNIVLYRKLNHISQNWMDTMLHRTIAFPEFRRPPALARALRLAGFTATGLVNILLQWHERARQRYDLAELSDHVLKDLGLSRADVEGEVRKPFWRA
jgi:uncharacterized protein YjiS (DUF1127 family)